MNNIRITWGLAPVLAVLVSAGCAHGPAKNAGRVVEAEGWAPYDSADVPGSRRRALAQAQRQAVEKATGVTVSARMRVDKAVAVEDRLQSRSSGRLRKWDLLEEKLDGGFLKIRIRADVSLDPKDLEAAGLPPMGDPSVSVVVRSAGLSDEDVQRASDGVRRAFLDRGFRLVEGEADLLVRAEARRLPLDVTVYGMRPARAQLSLQAVRRSTGQILSQASREASALDPSRAAAAGKALERAGLIGGEALADDLIARLHKD